MKEQAQLGVGVACRDRYSMRAGSNMVQLQLPGGRSGASGAQAHFNTHPEEPRGMLLSATPTRAWIARRNREMQQAKKEQVMAEAESRLLSDVSSRRQKW
jgi:hypothetical protein